MQLLAEQLVPMQQRSYRIRCGAVHLLVALRTLHADILPARRACGASWRCGNHVGIDPPAVRMTRMDETNDIIELNDLVVKRKGGGSIINQRPLFSADGETLYIVWKQVIRAYSTQTGDFVREFEPCDHRITGIVSHPENLHTIIGCTDTGELHFWSCRSGIITKKLKLNFREIDRPKIKTFHIVNYKTSRGIDICEVLITYIAKCRTRIYVLLFDFETGRCCKSVQLFANDLDSQDYYVERIGNHANNLIAILHDENLHILNPAVNLTERIHKTGKSGRRPTCLAGHPEEQCIATGDSSGRVVVWRSLFQPRPYTAVYHWHTLPVKEIVFSNSGGHMYTGGGECVLVKWTLANPNQKSYLPRLPAPIKHLTIAPNNLYVAVSTLDNGIVVVNPQRKLTSVIQNFTWGVALSSKDLFPAGLIVDPRTNSLVLNSRTGHVQFYDTHNKNLLFNINITAQNFFTQRRSVVIVNTEVTKIAVNHDGTWMATVEERDDKVSTVEVRLKFWSFDVKEQVYTLNTSIELPHEDGVNALQFQPYIAFDDDAQLAVTTGRDKKFKLWNLTTSTSIHKKSKHWHCYGVGDYRNMSATDADFSVDGSLLGIGFGSSLTVWSPETCTLKSSLTSSQYPHTIIRIVFGKHECCHLVVIASKHHIAVWNILSLAMTWSVPLNLLTLATDLKSIYMAAFTEDNTLYVFTPKSSQPIYTKKNVIEHDSCILAATFVPHLQEKCNLSFKRWQQKSQLYFLDSNQELLTLEPETDEGMSLEVLPVNRYVPMTSYGNLVASQTISNQETSSQHIHEHLGITGKGIIAELLSVSAHTLPPMRMLCKSFIISLMKTSLNKQPSEEEEVREKEVEDLEDSTDDVEDEDENEVTRLEKPEPIPVKESVETNEYTAPLVCHDWSFLSAILPDEEITSTI